MISSVRGEVLSVGLDHVVIEVGGVGLAVQATPSTLATLRRGEEVRLHTSLIVREDSLTLFGFADADARELFGLLLTVSGIGPRIAMATLAVLAQVPGIGRKGAERLTLELRDKVTAFAGAPDGVVVETGNAAIRAEVVEALAGLGFPAKQAEQAVDQVLAAEETTTVSTPKVLRAALATLGRKR
jgi:Holliday junction DNA helicase RuvA